MLKHLYLIFTATFIFGVVTGGILWLVNITGEEAESSTDSVSSFSITAHIYGGCSRVGCPSYRIAQDGTYTYIERRVVGGDIRKDGKLEANELRAIRADLGKSNLEGLLKSTFTGTCPIAFDGPGFTYDIEYKGEFYSFDSCEQDLKTAPFFKVLESYFERFSRTPNL